MKKIILTLAAGSVLGIFSACRQQAEQKAPVADSTASASSLMEDKKYDPSKIDAAAPVTEIVLHARGTTMTDMSYDLTELKVKAGSTIKLTLTNESTGETMQHNFVLIDEGTAEQTAGEGLKAGLDASYIPKNKHVYVGTKVTKPGETVSITFPAPDKGSYEYICTFPGHWAKMRGKFVVE